jgi:hypothetical protein
MRITTDHPNFISYLNDVTNNVIENIDINNYFMFTSENKFNAQFLVFTLIEKKIKTKVTILSEQLKTFLYILIKKNEKIENYEVAGLLNDIIKNFDKIIDKKENHKKTHKSPTIQVKK